MRCFNVYLNYKKFTMKYTFFLWVAALVACTPPPPPKPCFNTDQVAECRWCAYYTSPTEGGSLYQTSEYCLENYDFNFDGIVDTTDVELIKPVGCDYQPIP